MTSTMTKPLRRTALIRVLPQSGREEMAARCRARRRKAMWNTILEALTTMGLGACIILCAEAVICVV